jgi:branched-chain amino acid transport system substrate-binding protein
MNSNLKKSLLGVLIAASAFTAMAEDGVTENTILIGQTIGITGQIAGAVKELNEGANAYISQVNKSGGVHGRKIQLITLDDKFDPAQSAKNVEKLINEDKVFALFQNRGTPHTEAILPIMTAAKVPLVGPSTGATILHTPVNPLLFNVRARYQAEVLKTVEQFSMSGITQIALIHVDDSFGRDGLAGFNFAMAARKLTPALIAKFDRNKPEFQPIIDAILKAKPHAVIIVSSAPTAATIIKMARAAGNNTRFMTLSNNSSEAFVKSLGEHAAGVVVSQITPAPQVVTSKLSGEFKIAAKASGATMSYAAMEGFIAAKVLVEGLRRGGKKLTRESFIRGLESIRNWDLGGLDVSYGPDDHTGSEYVELTIIGQDGKFRR